MSDASGKRILLCCTCFAPKNVIGAIRMTKFVKYLVRQGYHLTVISPELLENETVDPLLECAELEKAERIVVPYGPFFKARIHAAGLKSVSGQLGDAPPQKKALPARGSLKGLLGSLRLFAYRELRNRDWAHSAKRCLRTQMAGRRFDCVISSHSDFSAHVAAGYALRKGLAARWIADFRDSMVNPRTRPLIRLVQRGRQHRVVRRADAVTSVSENSRKYFVFRPGDEKKVFCIRNGFDEDDLANLRAAGRPAAPEDRDRGVLTFLCIGILYSGMRDLSPFFRAMKDLLDEGSLPPGRVRLRYAGHDARVLEDQAKPFGLEGIIDNRGYVTRTEAIRLQSEADCVLVPTWCDEDGGGAMTGKLYECLMIGRPIVLLVAGRGRDSEPGFVVRDTNAGFVYEEATDSADYPAMKGYLLGLYREKQISARVSSTVDADKRSRFAYRNIVADLARIIEGVIR